MHETRRNLVIVRAGDSSLHENWVAGAAERSWDLVVSSYTEKACKTSSADALHYVPGGKWDGLFATIARLSRPVGTYDYVWLPDDDIDASHSDVETLFAEMVRYRLLIAQPALTWNSYYTYPHTLHCRFTRIRFADMVELMMPCFEAKHLESIIPLFADTATGWGLDWVWCRSALQNAYRYAILDGVTMHHSRPLGVHLYEHAESVGENASIHMENFLARFPSVGLDFKPTCYASRLNSKIVLGLIPTMSLLALSHASFLRTKGTGLKEALRIATRVFKDRRSPNFQKLSMIP